MTKPVQDSPWYRRTQIEFGINFKLFPDGGRMSLREHLFDPFFNLAWIGKELKNPRGELPEGQHWYVDCVDQKKDRSPIESLRDYKYYSRCFWLGFGCRILGLDVGVGIFYRKKNDD